MAVCIETAKRYNLDDYRTPVFIFERLCSIIYPVSGFSVPFCETFRCVDNPFSSKSPANTSFSHAPYPFSCLLSLSQEENEVTEFFVTLEKDPQQEDFLQGRMPGNPYSSNEPGIGPLMRDIKNKICQDCDLVALLEDDSGMEVANADKLFWLMLSLMTVTCHFIYSFFNALFI